MFGGDTPLFLDFL